MIIDQIKSIFKYQNRSERTRAKSVSGFAVLFSILLASFLITLGISIFQISLKEIQITTSIRDSQIAYYAADSARECALYWDVKIGAFPTCFNDTCSIKTDTADLKNPICNGREITDLAFIKDPENPTYYINIYKDFFNYSSSTTDILPVSDLKIMKEYISSPSGVRTTIQTWGHNTTIIGRRVERGIQQVNNQ
jgi:hypothetical protein